MRNLKKVLSVLLVVAIMAISMVPAFAAETTYTYSAQADALHQVGLFNGVSTTEFVPDLGSSLNREQGFALIVRLLGKDGAAKALTAADVTAATSAFGDAKDVEPTLLNTVAYAVKNGLVLGTDKGLIDPKGAMTGNDFATILLRNLGYTVDATGYNTATVTLADKGGLSADQATKFATKGLIRDDAVGMMYASLQAKYATGTTVIAKLIADKVVDQAKAIAAGIISAPTAASLTATVTGAKKFTLNFNAPVDPAKITAASVTVQKGASTYTINSFALAADNKSAVVAITNQISAGDYKISVTGLADTAVTTTVTAENERVDKIQFNSENAVLVSITDFTKVTVGYKILNQYGEDITTKSYSSVSFTGSKGTQDVADSKITYSVADPAVFTIGEKLTVTGTYVDSANNKSVFASAVLTVTQMAQVADLSISSLYNANNATLDVNSTFSDFKLLVDAKDQYGNSVSYSNLADALVMQSTDTSVLKLNTTFEQVTIDGSKKTALSLAAGSIVPQKAGTATVILVSKYSGKMAQFTVTVKDSQKIDTLSLQTPDYPVAGEVVKVPFTAVDKDGNEITKLSGLVMSGTPALTVSGGKTDTTAKFEQDPVSGKPVLNLDARSLTEKTTVYISGTTSTYKFVNFAITLQAPAKLDSVAGFKSSVKTNFLKGATSTDFSYGNVLVKDTYGRDVSKDQLVSKYGLDKANTYRFTLASSDQTKVTFPTVTGETYAVIDATTNPTITATDKGGVTATLVLQKYNTTSNKWDALSTITFALATVVKSDIQSYTPTSVASVYTNKDAYSTDSHAAGITVDGVLANGQLVRIPNSPANYIVTAASPIGYNTTTGSIYSTNSSVASDKELAASYVVTVYGASQTYNIPVATKVSGAVPVATTLSLYSTTDKVGTYAQYMKEADTVASVNYDNAKDVASVKAFALNVVKIVDQYGKTMPNATYIQTIDVSNVRDTDNKLKEGATSYDVGYSVYVTVITTDGKMFGFTVAIKAN